MSVPEPERSPLQTWLAHAGVAGVVLLGVYLYTPLLPLPETTSLGQLVLLPFCFVVLFSLIRFYPLLPLALLTTALEKLRGLGAFFWLFVLFLYGPFSVIFMLSLQGRTGGLTFPMRGFSLYWFDSLLFQEQRVGDYGGSFQRSLLLGAIVAVCTLVFSLLGGLAFRQNFRGARFIFYLTIASLVVPSILVSLGIGAAFNMLSWETNWLTSTLGAHLTWTIPFAFLIVLGVFNRFNPAYEEAARDLGAGDVQTFWHVILPLIAPSLIGVAILGFTLSYDEFTRSSLVAGGENTLPLEIFGMTTNVTNPSMYAIGTLTTLFSLALVALALAAFRFFSRRR
ncbi:MAG: ABC transporter permease [Cyanobacteria bacterium P01_F01_bin.33]